MTGQGARAPLAYSRIAGTGSYLPATALTNQDIERRIDTSERPFFERDWPAWLTGAIYRKASDAT